MTNCASPDDPIPTAPGAGGAAAEIPPGTEKKPWWAAHLTSFLTVPTICLVVGMLFGLSAIGGGVDVGVFKFHASGEFSHPIRVVLLLISAVLIFFGLALTLHTMHFWRPLFSLLYFLVNLGGVLLLTVFGGILHTPPVDAPTPTLRRFVTGWDANATFCYADVQTPYLRDQYQDKELLLICRNYDAAKSIDNDRSIQKNDRRRLNVVDNMEKVRIDFDGEFAAVLRKEM
jgi:hypothetical protein